MPQSPVTVLIVDDSPVAVAVLSRLLGDAPDLQVVGTARNGSEALDLVARLRPQVICADYHMPVMNGLEFTRRVMDAYPTPILCVSTSVRTEDQATVFKVLEAGAVDIFPKPEGGLNTLSEAARQELVRKVKLLAGVRVFRRRIKSPAGEDPLAIDEAASRAPGNRFTGGDPPAGGPRSKPARAVAIGASTGGPQVLQQVLGALPASFPVPVLCVQHISLGFLPGLVRYLNDRCDLNVKIARSGEIPVAGTVYFPPENTHLEVSSAGALMSSRKPPFESVRPAAHVLFLSVAAYYGSAVIGVLLTGMGKDGAEGLLAIARAGGQTIAQEEKSCTVFGMPGRAIELGAAQHVLPPPAIAQKLIHLCQRGRVVRS